MDLSFPSNSGHPGVLQSAAPAPLLFPRGLKIANRRRTPMPTTAAITPITTPTIAPELRLVWLVVVGLLVVIVLPFAIVTVTVDASVIVTDTGPVSIPVPLRLEDGLLALVIVKLLLYWAQRAKPIDWIAGNSVAGHEAPRQTAAETPIRVCAGPHWQAWSFGAQPAAVMAEERHALAQAGSPDKSCAITKYRIFAEEESADKNSS